MKIYALGDLHLSFSRPKPMDIFGELWSDHPEKIKSHWDELVKEEDLVIIPGDISWALKMEEAEPDFSWISRLPGEKVIIRGNHDYYWGGIGKLRSMLPADIHAIQNDSYFITGEDAICGSRGWVVPGSSNYEQERDEKVYLRELRRIQLSLDDAVRKGAKRIIMALHYPPMNEYHEPSAIMELLEEYPVEHCIFAHLHQAYETAFQGTLNGVTYHLVSADYLKFRPKLIKILD